MFKNCIKNAALLMLCLFVSFAWSQNPYQGVFDTINKDDLGEVSDRFQELFFDALKNRAIENYDKAIESLLKAESLTGEKEAVYFELGKNYMALERYNSAEDYFKKGLKEKPNEKEFLLGLNDVYLKTRDYKSAIPVVKQLAEGEIDYNENLAELYFLTQDYKGALAALDKIDAKKGQNESRSALRRQFYKEPKAKKEIENYLINQLAKKPSDLQKLVELMLLYESAGDLDKAVTTADKIRNLDTDNALPHLAYYQKFLKEGKHAEAVASLKKLINAPEVDNDVKVNAIKDFTELTKTHPEFTDDLLFVLGEESSGGNQSNQQMGEYYLGKDDAKALGYFKEALKETPNDYNLIRASLALMIKENAFAEAAKLAEDRLGIYPTQAILYLYKGQAENGLKNHQEAEEYLDMGIDFVVEDPQLQKKFYEAFIEAYQGMGNTQKANVYQDKLNKL